LGHPEDSEAAIAARATSVALKARRRGEAGPLDRRQRTFCIITVAANELVGAIHMRGMMPPCGFSLTRAVNGHMSLTMNNSHHARRIRARARRLSAGAWAMRMH